MSKIVYSFDPDNEVYNAYHMHGIRHAYNYGYGRSWATSAQEISIPAMAEVIGDFVSGGRHHVAAATATGVVYIIMAASLHGYQVDCYCAAANDKDRTALIEFFDEHYPPSVPEPGARPILFWNLSPKGPKARQRMISVPTWKDIRPNYSGDVQEAIDVVVAPDYRPPDAGKLILWRGVPGTGKTWAIRSLTREWQSWASFHYIIDPDALFGASPDYLLQVALGDGEITIDELKDNPLWRVLILEDAGELLATDAKASTGQAFSRLINLVDGFVGQGLKILVLITTNEELGKLHPAASRAGRCLMNLEFSPLTHAETAAWAKLHGVDPVPTSGRLADLYAAKAGIKTHMPEPVGFTS